MRILPIFCLIAMACLPARAARWSQVTDSSVRAVYLDSAGAVREGALVRTWMREVYTNEQRADQVGVMYYAVNTLMSYDCTRRTLSALFRVFYGSDGTELRRIALDAVDVPTLASPGSLQELLLERACNPPVRAVRNEGDGLVKVAAKEPSAKASPPASAEVAKAETDPAAKSAQDKSDGEKTSAKNAPTAKSYTAPAAKSQPDTAKPAEAAKVQGGKAAAPTQSEPSAPAKLSAREAFAAAVRGKATEAIKPAAVPARRTYYDAPRRVRSTRGERWVRYVPQPELVQEQEVYWTYAGPNGVDTWGKLKAEFAACASGKRQSPIDIHGAAKLELESIRFEYKPAPLRMIDNGHTVQINYAEGSTIQIAGERYELAEFHFHKPSEERINGRVYDLVAHLVHKSLEGRLAVVAVLFESGPAQNAFLNILWPHLPLEIGREIAPVDTTVDINQILPVERTYYAYMGSLTTPPCTEGVLWLVMKNAVPVAAEQVAVFGKLYAINARPVQPINGRLIKESK